MGAARLWVWGIALAAGWLAGCSGAGSEDAAAPYNPIFGGQTGSLVPCLAQNLGSVPAGDGAFIAHTRACREPPLLNALQLEDTDGNIIALTPTALDDGSVLLTAGTAIAPGRYTVSGGAAPVGDLVVTEATDLPMALGTLRFEEGSGCAPTFELELTPETLPYRSLLKLSATLDGNAPATWTEYGALSSAPNPLRLVLECPSFCLAPGPHRLELSATIAGEGVLIEPIALDFDAACPGMEESRGCALASDSRQRGPTSAWQQLAALGLLACSCHRRARERGRRR